MFCLSSNILVAGTIVLVLSIAAIEARNVEDVAIAKCKRTCPYLYRCYPYYSPDNEVVYAIEDGVCKVFANGCMFSSYNCNRRNSCLPELESVPKEKCQEFCANCDKEEKKRVCATYVAEGDHTHGDEDGKSGDIGSHIDHQIEYANKCEADRAACKTGIPYAFITEGPCTLVAST